MLLNNYQHIFPEYLMSHISYLLISVTLIHIFKIGSSLICKLATNTTVFILCDHQLLNHHGYVQPYQCGSRPLGLGQTGTVDFGHHGYVWICKPYKIQMCIYATTLKVGQEWLCSWNSKSLDCKRNKRYQAHPHLTLGSSRCKPTRSLQLGIDKCVRFCVC